MIHGVRDGHPAIGQQRQTLRFVEGVRRQTALAGADPAQHPLAVRGQLHQLVPSGVRDEEAARGQPDRLAGEAQIGGDRLRRYVGAVTAAQGALRRVLGLQLLDKLLDGVRMALAGVLGDDIPLGVDHHERRPGPYRVLLPRGELRVVEDRVLDAIALHGIHDRLVLGLVHKLRGVHTDDHDGVAVPLLQLPQLVQDMQTIHTAKSPEIQNDNASPQVREGQILVTGIQPAALADQLGGADACT